MTPRNQRGPRNLRELSLFSAGMYRGMVSMYMARAATISLSHSERAFAVRQARDCHHVYLARLREANGASGWRSPIEVAAVVVTVPQAESGYLLRRQAGAV